MAVVTLAGREMYKGALLRLFLGSLGVVVRGTPGEEPEGGV